MSKCSCDLCVGICVCCIQQQKIDTKCDCVGVSMSCEGNPRNEKGLYLLPTCAILCTLYFLHSGVCAVALYSRRKSAKAQCCSVLRASSSTITHTHKQTHISKHTLAHTTQLRIHASAHTYTHRQTHTHTHTNTHRRQRGGTTEIP